MPSSARFPALGRAATRRVDRLGPDEHGRSDGPRARTADIGYDETGDGPPLVLLHSASSSGREDFAAQLPLLRRSFHCYLPDAGPATTRWDAADGFRYDWLVDDLEAFADAMGLATFHCSGSRWAARPRSSSRLVAPSACSRSSSSGSRPSANRGRPSRGG